VVVVHDNRPTGKSQGKPVRKGNFFYEDSIHKLQGQCLDTKRSVMSYEANGICTSEPFPQRLNRPLSWLTTMRFTLSAISATSFRKSSPCTCTSVCGVDSSLFRSKSGGEKNDHKLQGTGFGCTANCTNLRLRLQALDPDPLANSDEMACEFRTAHSLM